MEQQADIEQAIQADEMLLEVRLDKEQMVQKNTVDLQHPVKTRETSLEQISQKY